MSSAATDLKGKAEKRLSRLDKLIRRWLNFQAFQHRVSLTFLNRHIVRLTAVEVGKVDFRLYAFLLNTQPFFLRPTLPNLSRIVPFVLKGYRRYSSMYRTFYNENKNLVHFFAFFCVFSPYLFNIRTCFLINEKSGRSRGFSAQHFVINCTSDSSALASSIDGRNGGCWWSITRLTMSKKINKKFRYSINFLASYQSGKPWGVAVSLSK